MSYHKVDVSEYTFSREDGFFVQESVGELVHVNGKHMISCYGGEVVVGLKGWYGDRDEAYAVAIKELEQRVETLHSQIRQLEVRRAAEKAVA
jgi:hypothetical protein